MASQHRVGSLEINQDMQAIRSAWTVQRVGWGVMALLALAALLGLLGPGPLSQVSAGAVGDPLRVEYDRFARRGTPTELRVALAGPPGADGEYRVWLSRDFAQQMQVDTIIPPPDRVELAAERLVYVFASSHGAGPTGITFRMQPDRMGRLRGQAGVPDGPSLPLDVFVYP